MDLMANKICKRCDKIIKNNEKGVTWITFKGSKELEKIHFHWNCFLEWRDESITNKAKKIYSETMGKVLPQVKGMIDKILHNEQPNQYKIC